MTGRELVEAFDWVGYREENGLEIVTMLDGNSVRLDLQTALRRDVSLMDDAIQSSVLPVKAMRRQLLIASAGLPFDALFTAETRYMRMAVFADRRGDVAGADAWRLVVEAIRNAKDVAAKAVAQQTWDVDE